MDMKWFAHGLNIFNLTKGNPPEEVFLPDDLPQKIAEAGGQRRYKNAAYAAEDEANRKRAVEKRERRRISAVAGMVAADRLALHRTIAFIEDRWRAGGEVNQTFREAEKVRKEEFDKIAQDPQMAEKFRVALEDMPDNINEGRRVLVDSKPVLNRSRPAPRRPR